MTYVPPEPVSIDQGKNQKKAAIDFSIAFNSAAGVLTIKASEPYTVSVYNAVGRCLWSKMGNGEHAYSLSTAREMGIYFVSVKTENSELIKRLVILQNNP